jgi:hypothetical protein
MCPFCSGSHQKRNDDHRDEPAKNGVEASPLARARLSIPDSESMLIEIVRRMRQRLSLKLDRGPFLGPVLVSFMLPARKSEDVAILEGPGNDLSFMGSFFFAPLKRVLPSPITTGHNHELVLIDEAFLCQLRDNAAAPQNHDSVSGLILELAHFSPVNRPSPAWCCSSLALSIVLENTIFGS